MEEDERRETAIASAVAAAASLDPKSKSSSSVSQARLSKFQELHKRRLQIKEKSKIKKKLKGRPSSSGTNRLEEKDSHAEECSSEVPCKMTQDTISNSTGHQEDVAAQKTSKKPQKLHWGLDTKERWERKSNM